MHSLFAIPRVDIFTPYLMTFFTHYRKYICVLLSSIWSDVPLVISEKIYSFISEGGKFKLSQPSQLFQSSQLLEVVIYFISVMTLFVTLYTFSSCSFSLYTTWYIQWFFVGTFYYRNSGPISWKVFTMHCKLSHNICIVDWNSTLALKCYV